jgi:activator of HSP90 ATPase
LNLILGVQVKSNLGGINMSANIYQEVIIHSSPNSVYETLLNEQQFSEVTGGAPTKIVPEEGGHFSLFGGMIEGRTIELVANERIVQAWRAANWEPGVYSIAKFDIQTKGDETLLVFTHSGFPEEQKPHLEAGWHENYWLPLQKHLSE